MVLRPPTWSPALARAQMALLPPGISALALAQKKRRPENLQEQEKRCRFEPLAATKPWRGGAWLDVVVEAHGEQLSAKYTHVFSSLLD